MSLIQATSGGKAPVIDDNIYEVVCTGVEDVTLEQPDQFGKTEKVRVHLQLVGVEDEDSGEPVSLDPLLNRTFGQKATLRKWATALLNLGSIDDGSWFETEDLVGHHARAVVKTETGADGKRGWPKVTDLMAMPKAAQKAATKPQEGRQPSEDAAVEELSDWWKSTRENGIDRKRVMAKSQEMFKAEPAEISGEQRAELYLALLDEL